MGVFTIDYGNKGQKIVDAFCLAYNYQDEIDDPENPGQMIPNPVTKQQFTKNLIISFIRQTVVANSTSVKAAEQARADALGAEAADVETIIIS